MNEEKFSNRLKNEMPETPYGFDTRVDAQVDALVRAGRKKTFALPNRRVLIAMVLVAVLGLSGVIGYAVNIPVPASTTIAARLDRSAGLTETTWYTNNTVSVAGLELREMYPGLTDKWYNIVPVDLTQKGRKTYTLVASNMYYIGEVYVDVSAKNVTVTYATYRGELRKISECLQWFTDPADITTEFLNDPQGKYEFGQSVSIENDLGGAEIGLLFVCNHVSYCNPFNGSGDSLVRYYRNLDEWKSFRADLDPLMERLEAQVIRMKNNATATDIGGEEEAAQPDAEAPAVQPETAAEVEEAAEPEENAEPVDDAQGEGETAGEGSAE